MEYELNFDDYYLDELVEDSETELSTTESNDNILRHILDTIEQGQNIAEVNDTASEASTDLDNTECYTVESESDDDHDHDNIPVPAVIISNKPLEYQYDDAWSEIETGCSVGPFLGRAYCNIDPSSRKPEDFFNALFDTEMWCMIADQTNNYAQRQIRKKRGLFTLNNNLNNSLHACSNEKEGKYHFLCLVFV